MHVFRSRYFGLAIHVLVWVVLLGIPTLLWHNDSFFGLTGSFFLVTSLYHIGLFYLNAYFLYPRLLNKKWWWLYILSILTIVVISFRVKIFILQLDPAFQLNEDNRRVIFFSLLPFIFASFIFRLVQDRSRFEKLEKEARTERLSTELKFLRSQISPHFLFNMMTNMVSLARQKSGLLEPSLIKLSELLRYMLYDSAENKIPVSSEIEHLENYISLQQLRFGDSVTVKTNIQSHADDDQIEPMLLIPFIENAFKHGIGLQKDPYIHIQLQVTNHELEFSVVNNYTSDKSSKDKNSGIGLANVKNRLALLYPGKYKLTITGEQGIFSVNLHLNLL